MTDRTRVILLVHLYGHLKDSTAWSALAQRHGVFLIEDCAQSHGAIEDGNTAGSIGQASAFSFYPTKNLGALGDGGAIVTSDSRLFDRSRSLRNYGQSERYLHPDIGLNSRLDEIQAAILIERLAWLPAFTSRRREIASQYREIIDNRFVSFLAPPREVENHVYHLFVVRTEKREVFQRHMQERGVQTLIHYPVPLHLQSSVEGIRRDPDGLERAEIFANQCVSLPCHPQLTEADIELVSSAANSFKA